jgi:hypothetical protein
LEIAESFDLWEDLAFFMFFTPEMRSGGVLRVRRWGAG